MLALTELIGFGAGGVRLNAVDFDGTNDYMLRGADLTGTADAATGIVSAWIRLDGGDAINMRLIQDINGSAVSGVDISRTGGNKFGVALSNAAGTTFFEFRSSNSFTAGPTWLHLLASWDTNAGAGSKISHMYVNGVSDKAVISDASAAFNIDYTATNWAVGSTTAGGSLLDGCLSEFYFAPAQFLDLSDVENREKFIRGGRPVFLGTDGSLPTGVAPLVYLNQGAATFNTNQGTGGNFSITGALTDASTSPSE